MDERQQQEAPSNSMRHALSAILSKKDKVQDHAALITPPPELRIRNPIPKPQNGANCDDASRSASQAIQQATQQASQSIQQASQSASQASRQASQSASQAIQQAQNSASQSIASASRSMSSAMSSASSVIESIQSSAAQAISRANGSMMTAQASASSVQSDASRAILQAGAAVAAATGSAAAAGSSFLAAAAKATQSAQASISAIDAAADAKASQASQQVTASQTAAVTATQAALAIVGSIIASTLITILIYFLIIRHKKLVKKRSNVQRSPGDGRGGYSSDSKFPVSDQVGTTIAASQSSNYDGTARGSPSGNRASFSLFPKSSSVEKSSSSAVKTTSVPWNPSKPPRAPTLGSWLKVQEVSPFGPINLPINDKAKSPLGGQLKSPLRSMNMPIPSVFNTDLPLRSPKIPVMTGAKPTIISISRDPSRRKAAPPNHEPEPEQQSPNPFNDQRYRESKASVWTDEVPDPTPSPPLQSPPPQIGLKSVTRGYPMRIPSPKTRVRTTAEWLASREDQRGDESPRNNRPSFGMPRNPRSGLPTKPEPDRQQSVAGGTGYVQGDRRFLDPSRGSTVEGDVGRRSQMSVGKAM